MVSGFNHFHISYCFNSLKISWAISWLINPLICFTRWSLYFVAAYIQIDQTSEILFIQRDYGSFREKTEQEDQTQWRLHRHEEGVWLRHRHSGGKERKFVWWWYQRWCVCILSCPLQKHIGWYHSKVMALEVISWYLHGISR